MASQDSQAETRPFCPEILWSSREMSMVGTELSDLLYEMD